jgi:hypothetical protein
MLPPFATVGEAEAYGYTVSDAMLMRASARIRAWLQHAGQPLSIDNPPDALAELTCRIAERLGTVSPELSAGVTSMTSGPYSQSLGVDAWRGLSGLTVEEKAVLKGMYPPIPGRILTVPYPEEVAA